MVTEWGRIPTILFFLLRSSYGHGAPAGTLGNFRHSCGGNSPAFHPSPGTAWSHGHGTQSRRWTVQRVNSEPTSRSPDADFSTQVFRLLRQRINTDNERNQSLQSKWFFLLRSSVNADSGLPDIPHVANFRQLSVAQRKSQYEAYQNSLKNRVLTIV